MISLWPVALIPLTLLGGELRISGDGEEPTTSQTIDQTFAIDNGPSGVLLWAGSLLVDPELVEGGGVLYLREFKWNESSDFLVQVTFSSGPSSDPDTTGNDLIEDVETSERAFTLTRGNGSSIRIPGPLAQSSQQEDSDGEPYLWRPGNWIAVRNWVNNLGADEEITLKISATVSHSVSLSSSAALSAEIDVIHPVDIEISASAALSASIDIGQPVDTTAISASAALTSSIAAEISIANIDVAVASSAALLAEIAAVAEEAAIDVAVETSAALSASIEIGQPVDTAVSSSAALSSDIVASVVSTNIDSVLVSVSAALSSSIDVIEEDVTSSGLHTVINGVDYSIDKAQFNSLSVSKALNSRNRARVRLLVPMSDLPNDVPVEGDDVLIRKNREKLFGGLVNETSWDLVRGEKVAHVEISCVSYAARLDEIRITGFVRTDVNTPVGDIVRTIATDYLSGEGFTTTQVEASNVVKGDVFDYITVAEAFNRLARSANCVWCVSPDKDIVFRHRDSLPQSSVALDGNNLEKISRRLDRQNFRSVHTVIGGPHQGGQRRQDFTNALSSYPPNGARREFPLSYRVDRIIKVSIDGVSQSFDTSSSGTAPWYIDKKRSVLVQRSTETAIGTTQELSVIYNYNFPIVVTRENSTAIAAHRRVHRLTQDSAIDSIELAEDQAEKELDRHDNPTEILSVTTTKGAFENIEEGSEVKVNLPLLNINDERWMVDNISITDVWGLLIFRMELLLRDHESRFEEWWDRTVNRVAVPTDLTTIQAPEVDNHINPITLGLEGLRLPKSLGGDYRTLIRSTSWQDIPGFHTVRLNGNRLPSNLVEWFANHKRVGTEFNGQIRLQNISNDTTRGSVVTAASANADLAQVESITLSQGANNYRLQARLTAAPTSRRHGLYVWGAEIDVGD